MAIVDLGSNTFHLLIATRSEDGVISEEYRLRVFVGLSDGGIKSIKSDRIAFGLETCQDFKRIIDEYEVGSIKLVGTSVLRKASNRMDFIKPCEDIFNREIEIITGNREAELIFKGVSLLDIDLKSSVIMDIGGGSVEFILVIEGKMTWCQSFPIGVGVLFAMFHTQEPISKSNYEGAKDYIRKSLLPLSEVVSGLDVSSLIGASGSFEVVKDIYDGQNDSYGVNKSDVEELIHHLIASDYQKRSEIKGLPQQRVKLIVVAMILIEVALEILEPNELLVSPYAIKEGLISEL